MYSFLVSDASGIKTDSFYSVSDYMSTMFKKRAKTHEIALQRRAVELGVSPRIIRTDGRSWMMMEKVDAHNLAETYGVDDVPDWIWDQIHIIVSRLFHEAWIEYIDITAYNFIEKDGVVWCIDYGDAFDRTEDTPTNWFLKLFIDNADIHEWNHDFA